MIFKRKKERKHKKMTQISLVDTQPIRVYFRKLSDWLVCGTSACWAVWNVTTCHCLSLKISKYYTLCPALKLKLKVFKSISNNIQVKTWNTQIKSPNFPKYWNVGKQARSKPRSANFQLVLWSILLYKWQYLKKYPNRSRQLNLETLKFFLKSWFWPCICWLLLCLELVTFLIKVPRKMSHANMCMLAVQLSVCQWR